MYTLTEEEIDAIIAQQEQEQFDKYVEFLQDLDNNRMTIDKDTELSDYFDYEKYPDEQLYRELCKTLGKENSNDNIIK